MFESEQNYVFLVFLKFILLEVQNVNKKFETEKNNSTKLVNCLVLLIKSLCIKIVTRREDWCYTNKSSIILLAPKPYFGYEFDVVL
jgi:hypothetical protein